MRGGVWKCRPSHIPTFHLARFPWNLLRPNLAKTFLLRRHLGTRKHTRNIRARPDAVFGTQSFGKTGNIWNLSGPRKIYISVDYYKQKLILYVFTWWPNNHSPRKAKRWLFLDSTDRSSIWDGASFLETHKAKAQFFLLKVLFTFAARLFMVSPKCIAYIGRWS